MNTQLDSPQTGAPGRIGKAALAVIFVSLTALLTDRLLQVQARLEQLESVRLDETRALHWNINSVQRDLASFRVDLDETGAKALEASDLSIRLETAENQLGLIDGAVLSHASSLQELEQTSSLFGPDVVDAQLAQRDERLQEEYDSLKQRIATTQADAVSARVDVTRLESELSERRDLSVMWRELLGPVVQIAGETSVGSGILLESELDGQEGNYRTYLLTAWHVIRDIQGDLSNTDMPVPIFIYSENGMIEEKHAKLLAFDAALDSALLELRTEQKLSHGAALATRQQLSDIRIFDEIYAIGCPLGNDPIPTRGEVATLTHHVDGELYWMINAPTYIGNSGGGIFASETHELLGIFSKIYTHGSLRPTIVPHMGLVTPLTRIYDWLELEGFANVIPTDRGTIGATRTASAGAH